MDHYHCLEILTFIVYLQAAKLDAKVSRSGIGILPEINVDQTLTNIPEGWCVEETKEGTVYANEDSDERVCFQQ